MTRNTHRRGRQLTQRHWIFKKPSNSLQNANTVISIIGVVVSVVLAVWALRLTYKYGESTEQIDTLTNIASKQQQQIDRLELLLSESKRQTGISNDLLGQMQSSNTKLVSQSTLLGKQVVILTKQQSQSNKLMSQTQKTSYNKLSVTLTQIGYIIYLDDISRDESVDHQRNQVAQMKSLLEQELGNSYLLQNNLAMKTWLMWYNDTLYHLKYLNDPDSSWFNYKITNGKLVVTGQRNDDDRKKEYRKYIKSGENFTRT